MLTIICRLLCIALLVSNVSCGGKKVSSEIEDLERPPKIANFSTETRTDPELSGHEAVPEAEQQGEIQANKNVQLSALSGSNTELYILEPYDEAWLMVIKALKYNKVFDITDLDRDRGILYVEFDPEGHDSSIWNDTVSFFTGGSDVEGKYLLKLVENGANTDVTAQMLVENSFDEDDDFSDPERGVEQFLSTLYKTLQES